MTSTLPIDMTQLANAAQHDPDAARRFLAVVYGILREIAHKEIRQNRVWADPTDVANEVAIGFLRPAKPTLYVNRKQVIQGFFTRVRNKAADLAKREHSDKRGGKKN